jgi:hypothetical protein
MIPAGAQLSPEATRRNPELLQSFPRLVLSGYGLFHLAWHESG